MDFPEKNNRNRLCHLYSESGALEEETIEFWQRILVEYGAFKQSPKFTVREIVQQFTSSGVIPAYFHLSLKLLCDRRLVIAESELKRLRKTDDTIVSNLFSTLWSTVWSLGSTNKVIDEKSTEPYYILSMLEEISQVILSFAAQKAPHDLVFFNKHSANLSHTFISFAEEAIQSASTTSTSHFDLAVIHALTKFTKPMAATSSSPIKSPGINDHGNITILIDYMLSQKTMRISNDEEYLQILLPQSSSSISQHSLLLDHDHPYVHLLQLRNSLEQVQNHIATLQTKIQSYESKAKHAKFVTHNVTQALQCLHLKRLCQKQEESLYSAQYKLEETIHTIEMTRMNVNILDAYRIATVGLKSYRKAEGVTVEKVADAMEAFQDELEEMKQLNQAIIETQGNAFTEEEEKEMELELAKLLEAAEEKQKESIPVELLPTVPTTPIKQQVKVNHSQSPAEPTFSP